MCNLPISITQKSLQCEQSASNPDFFSLLTQYFKLPIAHCQLLTLEFMLLLNKILPLFFLPLGFTLLCLLAGLVLRKRLFLWFGVLVLCLFSIPIVSDALMRLVEGPARRSPLSAVNKADAIVVLSGMLHQINGAPLGEWGRTVNRFEGGIDLFKAGKAPVIVFTRGQLPWQTYGVPEGDLLAKRAILLGVPQHAIRLTENVGNTAEESIAAAKLLDVGNGSAKRIILVTSAFHMPRARFLFEQAGFKVIPFRVDYHAADTHELTVLNYLPNGESLAESETALREMIGWVFYRAKGFLKVP